MNTLKIKLIMACIRSGRFLMFHWIYQLLQILLATAMDIWKISKLRKHLPYGNVRIIIECPYFLKLITWNLVYLGNCLVFGFLSGMFLSGMPRSRNIENAEKRWFQDAVTSTSFASIVEVYRILAFVVYMAYFCSSTPLCFGDITRPFYCQITLCLIGGVVFFMVLFKTCKRRPSNEDTEGAITNLIAHLWKRDYVGKGRDAKGLTHSSIKVETICSGYNTDLLENYMIQKTRFYNYSDSYGPLESYHEFSDPIRTNQKLQSDDQYSELSKNIDFSINEAYLFHGTDCANVESILTHGFDVAKCSRPFCGRGVYFAESPVKSDQYTGPPGRDSYVMILSRVLLGNMVVITDPKLMVAQNRPFCSECFNTDCNNADHHSKHQFDSVVLDRKHGLFREFVIFDNYLAYPEFVITYKRLYGYKYEKHLIPHLSS